MDCIRSIKRCDYFLELRIEFHKKVVIFQLSTKTRNFVLGNQISYDEGGIYRCICVLPNYSTSTSTLHNIPSILLRIKTVDIAGSGQ